MSDVTLDALRDLLKKTKRKHARAKALADETMNAGSAMIDNHNEFVELINSDLSTKEQLPKLKKLADRDEKLRKALARPLISLLDKETELRFKVDEIIREISMIEYRARLQMELREQS